MMIRLLSSSTVEKRERENKVSIVFLGESRELGKHLVTLSIRELRRKARLIARAIHSSARMRRIIVWIWTPHVGFVVRMTDTDYPGTETRPGQAD